MGTNLNSSKNGKRTFNLSSDDQIVHAQNIEMCQSALFHVLKELVQQHGKEIVYESMEWFMDKLKPASEACAHDYHAYPPLSDQVKCRKCGDIN